MNVTRIDYKSYRNTSRVKKKRLVLVTVGQYDLL